MILLLIMTFTGSITSCGNDDPDPAPVPIDDNPQLTVDPDLLGEWLLLSHENLTSSEIINAPEAGGDITITFSAESLEVSAQDSGFIAEPYETREQETLAFDNIASISDDPSDWDQLFVNAVESQFFEDDGEYRLSYLVDDSSLVVSYGGNMVMNLERL